MSFTQDQIRLVNDANDVRIQEFRNIKEKDLLRQGGRFIAEGKVVLQHLINASNKESSFSLEKVLILENRLSGVRAMLEKLSPDVPVYTARKNIIDEIAGFPMHRGILALGQYDPIVSKIGAAAGGNSAQLILVACGISNHDNIGSMFRNAAAFGVDQVLLDQSCCHPLYRKAIRVSVGSALTVPFEICSSVDEIFEKLHQHGFQVFGLSPKADTELENVMPGKKSALVLGTEGEGLPAHVMARIDNLRISQSQSLDSLNVATASGIALWKFATSLNKV